jgi:hypothetical protein
MNPQDSYFLHLGPRFRSWRLDSRACRFVDKVGISASVICLLIATVVSVETWVSDRISWSERKIIQIGGPIQLVELPWLLGSCFMIFGFATRYGRGRYWWSDITEQRPYWPIWTRYTLAVASTFGIATTVGNLISGAEKGKARVIPGPRYQISTYMVNNGNFRTVSRSSFEMWEARFFRLDLTFFTLFCLVLIFFGIRILITERPIMLSKSPPPHAAGNQFG